MGTNYYVVSEPCECCGKADKPLHIGKSSAGWTFSFHATDTIRSWTQWKEFLVGKRIEDEYEDAITLEDFIYLVESKKNEPNNQTKYCRTNHWQDYNYFLDDEGNSFSEHEFC